ncbi:hypothetical protein AAES_123512 [Amazona aestiva]|uniref:Uncharacterized protein n=1 Tax=Amazona aestiva TaxID=12930 RepID=A0A0Q3P9D5_AMAAE|nr:hypothetical protein AAES_123512 [Amazona aestiva]
MKEVMKTSTAIQKILDDPSQIRVHNKIVVLPMKYWTVVYQTYVNDRRLEPKNETSWNNIELVLIRVVSVRAIWQACKMFLVEIMKLLGFDRQYDSYAQKYEIEDAMVDVAAALCVQMAYFCTAPELVPKLDQEMFMPSAVVFLKLSVQE